MKVHMVSYDFGQNIFSKSKIHILPICEQKLALCRGLSDLGDLAEDV